MIIFFKIISISWANSSLLTSFGVFLIKKIPQTPGSGVAIPRKAAKTRLFALFLATFVRNTFESGVVVRWERPDTEKI